MWLTGIEMLFLKFILVTGRNVPDPDKIVGWTITPASTRYRPAKELNRVHILIMMILITFFPYLDLFKYWSLIDLIPSNDKQCSSKNISCLKENGSPEANSLTPRKAKAISTSCEKTNSSTTWKWNSWSKIFNGRNDKKKSIGKSGRVEY